MFAVKALLFVVLIIIILDLALRLYFRTQIKRIEQIYQAWELGHNAMRKGNYRIARRKFWLISLLDPKGASASINRNAIIYTKLGRLRRATALFKITTLLEPSAPTFHNLGLIYYERRRYTPALQSFQKAAEYEPGSVVRYLAIAKTQEMLGQLSGVVDTLDTARKLESAPEIKSLYIEAVQAHKEGRPLSEKVIHALTVNLTPWEIGDVEKFRRLIDLVREQCNALERLIFLANKKTPSNRTSRVLQLAYIFIHTSGASIQLLEENYSYAAFSLTRVLFETYAKIFYALSSRGNRGFAEIEKGNLISGIKANERLIGKHPASNSAIRAKGENRKMKQELKSLNKRYPNLKKAPGVREIAMKLDGDKLGINFELYLRCYGKGAESSHLGSNTVNRAVSLSGGGPSTGLFPDSYEQIKLIEKLTNRLAQKIMELPEVSANSKREYRSATRSFEVMLSPLPRKALQI